VRLSVVIPTYRRPGVLARCLDALERQTAPSDAFEVVVVRDAGDPSAAAVGAAVAAEHRRVQVRLLHSSSRGASAARNLGWREARAPLILFMGDDILASPCLVQEHLEWHGRRGGPDAGVLGLVRWSSEIRVTALMCWLDRGIQFDYPAISGNQASWFHFYTSNVSLPRALMQEIGGFDEERFPFNYEDIDVGYRLQKRGFRLMYNPRALGGHLHRPDLDQWRYRMSTTATAERRWIGLYPEHPAYFHDKLAEAAALAPARGRGRFLLRWIGPDFPFLGTRVWASADIYYRQQLASAFLDVWNGEEAHQAEAPANPARPRR